MRRVALQMSVELGRVNRDEQNGRRYPERGRRPTQREHEFVQPLAEEKNNKEVAAALGTSVRMVESTGRVFFGS
jgi:FixJ family two-component response regulator